MKRLLCVFALFSVSAFADTSLNSTRAWIQKALGNQTQQTFHGMTAEGQPCALYLTDKQFDTYFVVVGIEGTKDMNDYVGVATTQDLNVTYKEPLIILVSFNSWGNESLLNTVAVKFDEDGSPSQAVGLSNLRNIDCKMK